MPNFFDYTTGLPNPPNNPSVDVGNMQVNTNSINSIVNIDHVGFNIPNGGIHRQITMNPQSPPGLGDGQGVLFAGTFKGQVVPFWQNITGFKAVMGPNNNIQNGYTFLPGEVLLQWGSNTAVTSGSFASGSATGTTSFNFNFTANCWVVHTIPFYNSGSGTPSGVGTVNVDTSTLGNSSFKWKFNSDSHDYKGFYWIAIGN